MRRIASPPWSPEDGTGDAQLQREPASSFPPGGPSRKIRLSSVIAVLKMDPGADDVERLWRPAGGEVVAVPRDGVGVVVEACPT
jgi:hypothetical protein